MEIPTERSRLAFTYHEAMSKRRLLQLIPLRCPERGARPSREDTGMATSDITKLITTLLTSPTDAVVNSAAEQRRCWINWLKDVQRLVNTATSEEQKKVIIAKHLELAPVWKLGAQISVGVTMRVASIKRQEASASLGLGVGLLQASGFFGFMAESTSESIVQARAQYALTNDTQVTLSEYLADLGVTLASGDDVSTAIEKLGAASTPLLEQG